MKRYSVDISATLRGWSWESENRRFNVEVEAENQEQAEATACAQAAEEVVTKDWEIEVWFCEEIR